VTAFVPIPSIDLLGGRVVRLRQGDFRDVTDYGEPLDVALSWEAPAGTRMHVVDLEGARSGMAVHQEVVRKLALAGLRIQVGGGVRSADAAASWLDAGADRVVLGTVAADDPATFRSIVQRVGVSRVVVSADLRDGRLQVRGWQQDAVSTVDELFTRLTGEGITELLITEVGSDGMLSGPAFDLYRRITSGYSFRVQASGGVGSLGDITSLSRIPGLTGVIVGRALHERRFTWREAAARASVASGMAVRVIPCLDMRNGRVVKGVNFAGLRDAGDPVECARRYEREGADELVILDISATREERQTSLEMVRRVAESIYIPLTVGGGVRTVEDFGRLIQSGADRVAINTAAVASPELIGECAAEFGVQAVVLSCDARKSNGKFEVLTDAGSRPTGLDAAEWCRRAESLGAGEILLTSIDRDGTQAGYDIELLRSVTAAVRISVIASGGAGSVDDMRLAIERGGAQAVLAASLFHDGTLSIGAVKEHLRAYGIPVREVTGV
jgi:imidazole glycerol-phosphate synthase subunit HisF